MHAQAMEKLNGKWAAGSGQGAPAAENSDDDEIHLALEKDENDNSVELEQPSAVLVDASLSQDDDTSTLTGVATQTLSSTSGSAEKFYVANSNSKQALLSMAIGQVDPTSNRKLADFMEEPFQSVKDKTKALPTSASVKVEVKRRAREFGILETSKDFPKCDNWKKQRLLEWLLSHPTLCEDSIKFILSEEGNFYNALIAAQKEREREAAAKLLVSNWTSMDPHLRLYLCVCHDDARKLITDKDDVLERDQLDARSSDVRPLTCWEVVAKLYNDPSLVLTTSSLPELHHCFADPIELKFQDMPGGEMSPDDVKNRCNDARAGVITIVSDWERSGNGFGQRAQTDSDFGHMTQEHFEAGDNRSGFVKEYKGQREHHLHLWHLSDTLGVLDNVLSALSKLIAVSSDRTATTTAAETQNKRKHKIMIEEERQRAAEQEARAIELSSNIGASLNTVAIAAKEDLCMKLQERADELELKLEAAKEDLCMKLQERADELELKLEEGKENSMSQGRLRLLQTQLEKAKKKAEDAENELTKMRQANVRST